METQLRLIVLQQRRIAQAIAQDDKDLALRALVLNPYTCPMQSARPYVQEIWSAERP